jgi:hypothetical protein
MLSFHSWILMKWMMMTVGSNRMIVSFLCLVLCSRQTVMFCNPNISPGEMFNTREDFRAPRKRIRGANANKVGKLSWLISFCISVFINFLQHIMFYSSKSDSHSSYDHLCRCYRMFSRMYLEVCGEWSFVWFRSVVNDHLSDLLKFQTWIIKHNTTIEMQVFCRFAGKNTATNTS